MAATLMVTGKIGPAFRATVRMSLEEFGQVEAIALNEYATDSDNVLSTLIASVGRTATDVLIYDSTVRTKFVDFGR